MCGWPSCDTSVPAGTSSVQVSATVSGLAPNTTYLVNVVAQSAAGSSSGLAVTMTTAEDSCSVQTTTIASVQSKVTADQQQIAAQQTTINVQTLSVQVAQQNVRASPSTLKADRSTITQDQATLAQSRVGLTQDLGAITQAEASALQADTTLQATQLVALISGTVTSVNGTVGQSVSGGGSSLVGGGSSSSGSSTTSALVTIQGLHQLEVVTDFAEADALKIQVHQTAVVTLPAAPNTEVQGVVTTVSPIATTSGSVVTYPVTIALTRPTAAVKDGMTADVSVVVQSASNVLELPSAAITTTGTNSTVQVLSKGVTTTTRVTLGVVGGTYTQITSGLSLGETVVEPQASVSAATSTGSSSGGFPGGGGGGGFLQRIGGAAGG